jgi:hypothetical protein
VQVITYIVEDASGSYTLPSLVNAGGDTVRMCFIASNNSGGTLSVLAAGTDRIDGGASVSVANGSGLIVVGLYGPTSDGKWHSVTSSGGVGTGTVTSVGLSVPADLLNVSGSPVTSSGTITLKSTVPHPFLLMGA